VDVISVIQGPMRGRRDWFLTLTANDVTVAYILEQCHGRRVGWLVVAIAFPFVYQLVCWIEENASVDSL
jgi:hypothetical protein